MIFKNSKLFLVLLSLVFTILLAVAIFAIYDIRAKNEETSELLDEAERIVEARSLAQSIKNIQNNVAEDILAFDKLVLTEEKLVPLIEDIEELGKELKLETSIVSVEKVEDKKAAKPDMIRIIIKAQGSWTPTLTFLKAIESLPHRVTIDETGLSKIDTNWHLRIVLLLYLFY